MVFAYFSLRICVTYSWYFHNLLMVFGYFTNGVCVTYSPYWRKQKACSGCLPSQTHRPMSPGGIGNLLGGLLSFCFAVAKQQESKLSFFVSLLPEQNKKNKTYKAEGGDWLPPSFKKCQVYSFIAFVQLTPQRLPPIHSSILS